MITTLNDHKINYDLTFANLVASSISLSLFSLVISQRVPSELPDPFGESPSELPAKSHHIVRARHDAQA
ncbi:hypothetical protein GW17_00043672 [Ensete ventricosum]|nr:hypothetical protein GW17_00043672 [Ensete ventricosum]